MKTLIVSATREKITDLWKKPLFPTLLEDTSWGFSKCTPIPEAWLYFSSYIRTEDGQVYDNSKYCTDILVFPENKLGLSQVYNKVLNTKEIISLYDCVIFVHDDVAIQHPNMLNIIEKAFKDGNSVVGLAGATEITLKAPCLWHLMGDRSKWSGAVAHQHGDQVYMTSFGPIPQRCLMLDGLFLAINVKDVLTHKITFDPCFDYHFYDIDFSLQCNKAGLKLTTSPIWVTHSSPGLKDLNDPIFVKNQQKFLDKWLKK